jgi:DNA-binding PadR family transcriptional regulator
MASMREASYYSLAALLDGPAHGYGMLERVREMTGGKVRLTAGTLYGVLDRLVDEGLIRPAGNEIVNGRARQYYEITEAGSGAVLEEAERMAAAVRTVRKAVRRPSIAAPRPMAGEGALGMSWQGGGPFGRLAFE